MNAVPNQAKRPSSWMSPNHRECERPSYSNRVGGICKFKLATASIWKAGACQPPQLLARSLAPKKVKFAVPSWIDQPPPRDGDARQLGDFGAGGKGFQPGCPQWRTA